MSFLTTPPAATIAPTDGELHVIVAPQLRGRPHEVIRHDGDTDEAYADRCELVALFLEAAKES